MGNSRLLQIIKQDFQLNNYFTAYYFNLKTIEENLLFLKNNKPANLKILFPVKSFSHSKIINLVEKYVDGFDISNENELKIIDHFSTDKIIWSSAPFHIPNLKNKVHFFDFQNNGPLPNGFNTIRVNTEKISGKKDRFGLNLNTVDNLIKNHPIKALHFHFGRLTNTVEDYKLYFERVSELDFIKKSKNLHLNLGGGFYNLSKDQFKDLFLLLNKLFADHFLYLEPGRWVFKNAGHIAGKILNIYNHNLITSISESCHLKWKNIDSSYFFPDSTKTETSSSFQISGPTCFENDYICENIPMNIEPQINDLIIIDQISGYSVGWNHTFNGINEAQLIFLG